MKFLGRHAGDKVDVQCVLELCVYKKCRKMDWRMLLGVKALAVVLACQWKEEKA